MSRYADQRREIKAQLSGIAGLGSVYDAPKNPTDEATFQSIFVRAGYVNGVTITRADGTESTNEAEDEELLNTVKIDNWIISFYYGFKDDASAPSEYVFQELVEAVENKFRFLQNLNGKAERSYPLNRQYSGMWQVLGGILCHKAEWRLPIQSRIYND